MRTGSSERPDLPLAVVVGAGGMGMAIARRLGNHWRILLADINAERLEQQARAMRDDGYDAQAFACDITDPDAVARLVRQVERLGPLRAVAHVAAKSPSMGEWQDIMRLNLVGAALIERSLLPLAQPGTAAVFISSLAAHLAPAPGPEALAVLDDPLAEGFMAALDALVPERTSANAYSLAKLAMNRMCARQSLAWGQRGARILSMSPGLIATPMGALEFAGPTRGSKLELLKRTPAGREGTMLEMADVVEFLLSDRASYITGTDLLVDGGVLAAIRNPPAD